MGLRRSPRGFKSKTPVACNELILPFHLSRICICLCMCIGLSSHSQWKLVRTSLLLSFQMCGFKRRWIICKYLVLKYHSRNANVVANVLSRKSLHVSYLMVYEIVEGFVYLEHPTIRGGDKTILTQIYECCKGRRISWISLDLDGLILYWGRICIRSEKNWGE